MGNDHQEPTRARDYLESLNRLFERIGIWSFGHRWTVFCTCTVLLIACAYFASQVRFDNSFEAYFDTEDPAYSVYNWYRSEFGSDEISYLLYSAPRYQHGPFDLGVMRKIQILTRALEDEVPFVKEVTSLANVEYLEGVPGGLEVFGLLDEFPTSQAELLQIRDRVLAKPIYVDGLVSRDAKFAAIILAMERSSVDPLSEIKLDPNGGDGISNLYPQVTYHKIEEILARPEFTDIEFHHVGDVPLNAIYNEIIGDQSARLGFTAFAIIGLLLFVFFRRPIGVLGPLVVVAMSIMVALAWVGFVGWRLDLMFTITPTLLIAVGVADAVHIISEFRAHHAALGNRRDAARQTLYLVGTPCLLTSLTTAAGFASMSIAPIKAISHFAIYSAIGVLAAFVLSVTLLFVLLSFGPKRFARESTEDEKLRAKGGHTVLRLLSAIPRFDVRHRKAIIAFSCLVFVVSAAGISRLRVDSNFLDEFSKEEPVRQATHYVDEIMGGLYGFIYLFDSGTPEGIWDPDVLRDIDRLQAAANRQKPLVKKTYSVGDLLKDINKTFHEEDAAYYVLPETRKLAAQYLLLYEMSGGEELEDYLSSDFSRASLELRCRAVESSILARMAGDLDAYLQEHPPQASTVTVTGIGALWLKLQEYITTSQIRGFLLAFTVIGVLMCLLFKSVKTGLIAMVPNVAPVVLTLGGMGWADLPLDYTRLLIATVAIGISVDDTIHHMTRFHLEFRRYGSYEKALHAATLDVGRALFITSVVLVAGFLVFLHARLDSIANFGSLLSGTIFAALLADFFLMPALVLTFKPFGPESKQTEGSR